MNMTIDELFKDKTIKPKEKTETISKWLMESSMLTEELIVFAEKAKDAIKATCIEALEYTTKQNPKVADENMLKFVTLSLTDKAPRVKWESARVIGNIVHLFPPQLEKPVENLLKNTNHEGTVVRWSAAFAIGEIIKLKTKLNTNLIPKVETIAEKEEKNSIRKIYLEAIKRARK